MSDLTRLLHAALIREQHIDRLFAELKHQAGPERRRTLGKIEALSAERDPLLVAWLQAELEKEEVV